MRIVGGIFEEVVRRRSAGWWAAVAAGLVVSMSVARFFLAAADGEMPSLGPALLFGGLFLVAFVCTTFGAVAGSRADGGWMTALVVLLSNAGPPTLLFLPTVIGVVFSLPAGLAAFAVVLPLVLLARRNAEVAAPGWIERERLFGAAWLIAASVVMTALDPGTRGWLERAPALVCALAGIGYAGLSAARDVYRSWLAAAARLGRSGCGWVATTASGARRSWAPALTAGTRRASTSAPCARPRSGPRSASPPPGSAPSRSWGSRRPEFLGGFGANPPPIGQSANGAPLPTPPAPRAARSRRDPSDGALGALRHALALRASWPPAAAGSNDSSGA